MCDAAPQNLLLLMHFAGVCTAAYTCLVCRAGFETTATALSFAVYLLGQHPDVQQKIAAEVSALGNRCAVTPRFPLQDAHVPPTSGPIGVASMLGCISLIDVGTGIDSVTDSVAPQSEFDCSTRAAWVITMRTGACSGCPQKLYCVVVGDRAIASDEAVSDGTV